MSEQTQPEIALATGGDPEALTASLSERIRGRLVLFAARRLGGEAANAEDVVQEAFRTVLEALRAGRIFDPAALPAFAYETVRNLCMHRGRSAAREGQAMGRFASVPSVAPEDVLTAVINDEQRRAVRAALDRLDEGDRRLLEMTYMDLRTSEDIGRELNVTPVAVRVRRMRALRRLGAHLAVTRAAGREQR
jgi:RNA polymerase sigma factor (sigma-70 family)